jgi:DNA polymerase-3 subunit gamma/tau
VRLSVVDAWEQTVKSQVKPLVRALYSAGSFIGNVGDTWQFAVPNEAHGAKCNEHSAAVEAALSTAIGAPIKIEFVVGARAHDDHDAPARPAVAPPPAARSAAVDPAADHDSSQSESPQGQSSRGESPRGGPTDDRSAQSDSADRAPGPPGAESDGDPFPLHEPWQPQNDDEIDLSELTDAPPESVKTPIDRLAEAFPGSELINDD